MLPWQQLCRTVWIYTIDAVKISFEPSVRWVAWRHLVGSVGTPETKNIVQANSRLAHWTIKLIMLLLSTKSKRYDISIKLIQVMQTRRQYLKNGIKANQSTDLHICLLQVYCQDSARRGGLLMTALPHLGKTDQSGHTSQQATMPSGPIIPLSLLCLIVKYTYSMSESSWWLKLDKCQASFVRCQQTSLRREKTLSRPSRLFRHAVLS